MGSTPYPPVPPPGGGTPSLPGPGQPGPLRDGEYGPTATPNAVSFAFDHIGPPAAVYIQRDDVIVVEGMSQVVGEVVQLFLRLLVPVPPQPGQPDTPKPAPGSAPKFTGPGYIQTIQVPLNIAGLFTTNNRIVQLQEGYLLSATIVATSATLRGQTFVRVFINRGNFTLATPNVAAMLFADYVTKFQPAGWPFGRTIGMTEGPGFLGFFNPGPPAAGVDINFVSNLTGRVRLNTFSATFTASAAVANRVISFVLAPSAGLNNTYAIQDTVAVTASQVVRYSLAATVTFNRGAGAGTAANPLDVIMPLPGSAVGGPSITFNSVTQGIQAADAWSNIQVNTEEWFDGF